MEDDVQILVNELLGTKPETQESLKTPRVFRSIEAWEKHYFPNGLPELPEQEIL